LRTRSAYGDHDGGGVNKADLIEALTTRASLKKVDAARAVDALFGAQGVIVGALRAGAKVQVTGFGTFHSRRRPSRAGRNPRTGKAIQIRAAVVPVFRPGQGLRDALNRRR
jgi:DNA-binding protein HU-beta